MSAHSCVSSWMALLLLLIASRQRSDVVCCYSWTDHFKPPPKCMNLIRSWTDWDILYFFFFWVSVSCSLDEPGGDPPPQREAARSRSQLPPSTSSETGWHHHPVQPAQAVEHHGETGPEDHEPLSSALPARLPAICTPDLGERVAYEVHVHSCHPGEMEERLREDVCSERL